MTGQSLRRLARKTAIAAITPVILFCATEANAQGYPQYVAPSYVNSQYGAPAGPSGSVSAEVVNFNGRGMGVLGRGGHVAGDGIGRGDSISYIEAMPYVTFGESLLFGDARLVRGNEGGLTWSFGGGFRHYFHDVDAVFGVNGFFDRDQFTSQHFKGWGIGAELLSDRWEWRGNLYKPFGTTRVRTGAEAIDGTSQFVGNELRFSRRDFFATAFEGYDTEIGFLLPGRFSHKHQIRAFTGGYFFEAEGLDIPGWKARLQADITDFVELNLAYNYDSEFESTLNFGVALELGGFRENVRSPSSRYRLGEPVRRNYTFATSQVSVVTPNATAFNEATNAAFNIVHVSDDASASGDGTVENPFSRIIDGLAAGGDIVFVHAGSVYDDPALGNTVQLTQGDRLLGEGAIAFTGGSDNLVTTHFLEDPETGSVKLGMSPRLIEDIRVNTAPTLLRPTLSNYTGNAVTLSTGSEFSGFILSSPQATGLNGIYGDRVEDTIINQNRIVDAVEAGIFLENVTGLHQITDSRIDNASGAGIHIAGGDGVITFGQSSNLEEPVNANLLPDPGLSTIQNQSGLTVHIENTLEDGIVSLAGGLVTRAGTSELITTYGGTIDGDGGAGVLIEDSAGDVTIDNLSLVNLGTAGSPENGIQIDGGSGRFRFQSSIRADGTTIEGVTGTGVQISGLQEAGEVLFISPLEVSNYGQAGVNIEGIAGEVGFGDDVMIGPGTGTGLAILRNEATAGIEFDDNVDLNDITGVGIQIEGNMLDTATNRRTRIRFGRGTTDATTLTAITGTSLAILGDASDLEFAGDLNVNGRGATGILVDTSTGRFTFAGTTTVNNANAVNESALAILTSSGHVEFSDFIATGTLGDPTVAEAGVFLLGNTADALGNDADILFRRLEIDTAGGATSLIAAATNPLEPLTTGNSSIIVLDGEITSNPGSALDIRDSGVDMRFQSIESIDSPDVAIRIENTRRAGQSSKDDSSVVVTGMDGINVVGGGSIETAATAGAVLNNAGIVRFNNMEFLDNEIGIVATYDTLQDPSPGNTLPRIQTGVLGLEETNFEQNNQGAIQGTNVPNLEISGGDYEENGDAGNAQQIVLLNYTEDPSDNTDDENFWFSIDISGTEFETTVNDFNQIDIRSSVANAGLLLRISDNSFEDFGGAPVTTDLLTEGRAVLVSWDGPVGTEDEVGLSGRSGINNNSFELIDDDDDDDSQRGIEFVNFSSRTFDSGLNHETIFEISGNTFSLVSDLEPNDPNPLSKWGASMELQGPGSVIVDNNNVGIEGPGSNDDFGFYFDFDEAIRNLQITNNEIRSTANSDNVRGIFVDDIAESSVFDFEGNVINLLGTNAEALRVDASGVIRLRPTNGAGNTLNIATDFDNFRLDYNGAVPTGGWLINGARFPDETGLFIP